MPTAWDPCPGKVNAAVINTPGRRRKIAEVGPKDTAGAGYVKPPPVPFRRLGGSDTASLSLAIGAQNPYKPRHPWIPAGS